MNKVEEFVAHGASVGCLALGQKSGRVMVTGGHDKKVNLWAIGKHNCIMSLTGHTTAVECAKFSQNEDLVCAGSASGALKVWDLEAAKLLRTLTGHKTNIRCLDFHPYGDFVASGSFDTNIKLWDIRKKGCMYTYKGHSKDVHCLKFSPDGRWLASGGDEGSVKLWDLPAGKMLAELKEHTSAVTDVAFHPNEFLLASSSADGTVKFWDLESFQQVSSTVNNSGPIRQIIFHSDGKAIFSAARDVLKVYGWEPARTFDTVFMGWGKISDISVCDNQLIAGGFSLTNVSIYVVDLKKVKPFGNAIHSKQMYSRESVSRQSTRRNFVLGQTSASHLQLESLESNRSDEAETGTSDGDESSLAEIMSLGDYKEIFKSRREHFQRKHSDPNLTISSLSPFGTQLSKPLSRSTQPLVSNGRSLTELAFIPTVAPEMATNTLKSTFRDTLPSIPHQLQPLRVTPTQNNLNNFVKSTSATSLNHLSYNPIIYPINNTNNNINNNNSFNANHNNHRITNLVHPRPSETVSIVRPVINDNCKPNHTPIITPIVSPIANTNGVHNQQKAAIVFPETRSPPSPLDAPVEMIPETRDHPAGLDLDEFLPKHLQDTMRLGIQPQPEMTEPEAMSAIRRGHKSIVTVLSHRRKNLCIILAMWSAKNSLNALEQAIHMEDQSVIVDILNVIILKPAVWTLDMCQILLPCIQDLLQSKYESYMSVGCAALKLILKQFAPTIKTNITAPPGIGVDISREERYNKCMSCYNHLLSVRAFILKRQTLQGKLGRCFRELHILMQNLE
ncbi:katanin p80 WD40 repeat-containing subunit B1-like isoform X2 [Oppia nitens]|uniref:katanin p80 WD40 repeat-containing subunit B1-like isoform X2 n=1 Tax=Oppia nitens TaxID=1686743 RepID=UPI0023D9DAA7|nr:katanin p80 WD40 repeat-containing subunit B1-like isoform X2 [Oppia nitens]